MNVPNGTAFLLGHKAQNWLHSPAIQPVLQRASFATHQFCNTWTSKKTVLIGAVFAGVA